MHLPRWCAIISKVNRSYGRDESDDNQTGGGDKTGRHAKSGFAGKLRLAEQSKPEGASEKAVQAVTAIAVEYDLTRHEVPTLWRRIQDLHRQATSEPAGRASDLTEWGDGE
mgnify:CR=1 FL=1